jgi:tetratricopeptide (TPR) repeat protein
MGITMIACIAIFRFLYNAVPFLATLAIGAIVAFGVVILLRLLNRKRVSLRGVALKKSGQWTPAGAKFMAVAVPIAVLVVHSGFIRYHEWQGYRGFDRLRAAKAERRADDYRALHPEAVRHLELAHRFGMVRPVLLNHSLAALHYGGPDPRAAEPYLRRVLEEEPADLDSRLRLIYLAVRTGDFSKANRELETTLASLGEKNSSSAEAKEQIARAMEALAEAMEGAGRADEAKALRERAARQRTP